MDKVGSVARKLRIQFEGAIYHVINRGNYRQDVFGSVGAAQAFETTLAETCELFDWQVHAYVIMRNHFHLAVETARANLTEGMHWLTGTSGLSEDTFSKAGTRRSWLKIPRRWHEWSITFISIRSGRE